MSESIEIGKPARSILRQTIVSFMLAFIIASPQLYIWRLHVHNYVKFVCSQICISLSTFQFDTFPGEVNGTSKLSIGSNIVFSDEEMKQVI